MSYNASRQRTAFTVLADEGLFHCFTNNKAAVVLGAAAVAAVPGAAAAVAIAAAVVGETPGQDVAIGAAIRLPTLKNYCGARRTVCVGCCPAVSAICAVCG